MHNWVLKGILQRNKCTSDLCECFFQGLSLWACLISIMFMSSVGAAPKKPISLEWRGVWEWSLPKRNEADLIQIAEAAQALGFNALMMYLPPAKLHFMQQECHMRGLKLYYSTVFSYTKPEWAQEILPQEKVWLQQPQREDYMFGGEPLRPEEIFRSPLPCYNRPEVRQYYAKLVAQYALLPVDGLAFDAVGYQNYYRCYCPICEEKVNAYRRTHPHINATRATEIVAEETLVGFIHEMAAIARQRRPDISLTIHIYPWFRPHPYYGHRTNIDYVGQTVSWFFCPHWALNKVESLTKQLINEQHRYFRQHWAAPFIGFDGRLWRNYRSSRRICQELQIIKTSGARALQMAELGYIWQKPIVAQAIAKELGGCFRAPQLP